MIMSALSGSSQGSNLPFDPVVVKKLFVGTVVTIAAVVVVRLASGVISNCYQAAKNLGKRIFDRSTSKVEKLERQLEVMKSEHEKAIKKMEGEHQELLEQIIATSGKKDESICKAQQEIHTLKARVEQDSKRHQDTRDELDNIKCVLIDAMKAHNIDSEEGKSNEKAIVEALDVLTAQVNAYSREVERQKGLVEKEQEKSKQATAEYNEQLVCCQKMGEKLQHQIERNEGLFKANRELMRKLREANAELCKAQDTIQQLQQESNAKDTFNEQLKRSNMEFQERVSKVRKDNNYLSEKLDKAGEELKVATDNAAGLGKINLMLRNQVEKLNKEVQEVTVGAQNLAQQVQEKDAALTVAENKFRRLDQADVDCSSLTIEGLAIIKRVKEKCKADLDFYDECKRKTLESKATQKDDTRPDAYAGRDSRGRHKHDSGEIPENVLMKGLSTEIKYFADAARKASQGPSTEEVIFNEDDENDDRPYDPNLVCTKCGKQYRIGEIQKLRRHLNEFCTGIR
ncbi:hypothetical protein M3P05_08250 [Sansalvadorimonas sp. 2012CJ34-2]|uniref:Uncharacterized protein n=1 Tax=Parendozoicomonas callyspongiae TaxID=2942213 RepID=A0ABT0PEW7_9GAMM|nr:hypothetical protein [Sansalvadorimonas sp. 2012CJ34-2]MCL6269927.1 hypothetical protein [Sansalvadorimonas sp. 2012CJ34-2]